MPYRQNAPQILERINNSENVLLISHENPDGDTLGSLLALSHFLDYKNIRHTNFCPSKPADYFQFLPKIESYIHDWQQIQLTDFDLVITIDCGDLKRTGRASELLLIKETTTLINIDHHDTNDNFGHINLVIPEASSTSEIIFNFFKFHNFEIDKQIATNLLTGIITDTMNFTNPATTEQCLEIAGVLLNKGARINQIIAQIARSKDLQALKLWGKILSRLQYNSDYNYAYTVIRQKDLQKHNIDLEATDGLANFLSTIQDIDFILLLTEIDDTTIKGSLRTTKNNIDVSQMAKALGGGGHAKAAGFKINGQLKKTLKGWQIKR